MARSTFRLVGPEQPGHRLPPVRAIRFHRQVSQERQDFGVLEGRDRRCIQGDLRRS
jgi:hypothetical protein